MCISLKWYLVIPASLVRPSSTSKMNLVPTFLTLLFLCETGCILINCIRHVLVVERDTWHIESKQMFKPPKYLIIIVNIITYSNNRFTKNKSRMPLDLCIKWGPYNFFLQASVDHHGYSMNSGHYTASINCCGKHFTVKIIQLLNVILRIPMIHLLPIYFCTHSSWNVRASICLEGRLSLLALSSVYSPTLEDGSWSTPMVPTQLSVPLQHVEE